MHIREATKKKERDELFLDNMAVHLNKGGFTYSVVGGDFNCILNAGDTAGSNKNFCSGLKRLIELFKWKDIALELKKNIFTFFRGVSQSRLDRFYAPLKFVERVTDFCTIPVAFSDHCAVVMKVLSSKNDVPIRGRGYWKANSTIVTDVVVSERYNESFQAWKMRQLYTNDKSKWWNEIAKHKTMQFYKAESWDLNRRIFNEKKYFYGKMQEWMDKRFRGEETLLDIKIIKSRLIEIESNRLRYFGTHLEEGHIVLGEMMNIYQVSAQIKRLENTSNFKLYDGTLLINDINNLKGMVHRYYSDLFSANVSHENSFLDNDDPIHHIVNSFTDEDQEILMRPINEVEFKSVLESCSKKKSPGPDGLTYEFYLTNFNCVKDDLIEIFNGYLVGSLRPPKQFSDGIITLIPKKGNSSNSLDDYRPISLLNCDYKLFMKIIAERIKPKLNKLLGAGQTACLPNSSCVNNLLDIRRILTRSCENKSFKGCLVSVDLNKAFDRVNHAYLWKVLEKFRFPPALIDCLKYIYQNASSRILVNGFLTNEINIDSSVRQGCPLSMILFVLYIEPLLRKIADNIAGILVYNKFITVMAFADDIVVFVRNDVEFDLLLYIFETFSRYADIKINLKKSVFLRFNRAPLGPQFIRETSCLKVLGVIFENTWSCTVNTNYKRLISSIKHTMQMHSIRRLNLIQRCLILNVYILSKIWYVAQVFPPSNSHLAQIKSASGKFIWNGNIFKVNRNQLYLDYLKGGLNLVDPEAKTKALFIKNILYNVDFNGNFADENYLLSLNNSQKLTRNARDFLSLCQTLKEDTELTSTKLLYNHFISANSQLPKIEHVIDADWAVIWENIHQSFLNMEDRSKMFVFVNDLVPNREKLKAYNIGNLVSTNCEKCGLVDSNTHRLKECPKAKKIWEWCSQVVQSRYGVNIHDLEDILQFRINLKSKKHKAVLWLTVRVISYNIRVKEPSLFVFKKDLREMRWNNRRAFKEEFGNLLNIC